MKEFLDDMASLLDGPLPLVERFDYKHFAYACEGDEIVEIRLNNNKLEDLPSSIGKLAGLRLLDLDRNRLSSLPPGDDEYEGCEGSPADSGAAREHQQAG